MIKGTVAIVGRPNVGKSTLFNALTRTRNALVDDCPGLTRDRLYGVVYFDDMEERGCMVVDTGGFETEGVYYQPFSENIVWQQAETAIDEADIVVLVFDGKAGLHPHDEQLLRHMAKKNKPVIPVVNKVDIKQHEDRVFDFYQLGIDQFVVTSAAHMRGVGELLELIETKLTSIEELRADKKNLPVAGARIALVGRPNAGKSSILNRLIGEERSLVSEVAGTTRDSIDTPLAYNGKSYVLVDTAGIRRRSRINDKVESLSVMRSMQAIERSDVVLLVLDATQMLTDQDARIAAMAAEQYKAMAIIVNKWDLVENKTSNTAKEYTDFLRYKLKLLAWVPVLYVSCLENQRVHNIMQLVEAVVSQFERRVETRAVNAALHKMAHDHTPALIKRTSKRVKFYYATQVRSSPPTLLVFCNVAREIQEGYKRYMINRFREDLGFIDVPLRIIFRSKEDQRKRKQEEIARLSRQYDPGTRKSQSGALKPMVWDQADLPEFSAADAQNFEFEVDASLEAEV
ncbi:MAG: ribosome biogenesis GTPase Der [bacterium]